MTGDADSTSAIVHASVHDCRIERRVGDFPNLAGSPNHGQFLTNDLEPK